jgi:alpha-methylacyl-CoA racemase
MAGPRQSADIGGPLRGIRVLDFSRLAPGPYGSMLLADLGADVIRVERVPLGSDMPRNGDVVGRGKRSVGLNLKDPDGVEAALRILESCDVLLEGFRPGVMERLGLGPDEVASRNPRVVYARMTGWGQESPIRDRAGHDINYIAVSGVLSALGRAGEKPYPPINLIGDFAGGGLYCAFGIVCALLERERSGKGQVVDAAMVDGAASLFSFFAALVQWGAWKERGTNMLDGASHFYNVYETSDGGFMSVGAIEPQFYAEFLDGLGLAGDPDLAKQMDQARWPEFTERIAAIFKTNTRDEWTKTFQDRDACTYPVLGLREAPTHPFNAPRHTHVAGPNEIMQPAPGPRFSRTSVTDVGDAPDAGADTRAVLADAGYSDADIEKLGEAGAVAWPSSE